MNKKILTIGSIIVCIILVLVTFTSVVGFQSVESSGVRGSPLFEVRGKRALGEDSRTPTCNYLKKGEIFLFPPRDSETSLNERFIEAITKIDDDEFDGFIQIVFNRLKKDKTLTDRTINDVIQSLYLLRLKPNDMKNIINNADETSLTEFYLCTVDGHWSPGCIIYFIGVMIVALLLALFFYLATVLGAYPTTCSTWNHCC